MTEKTGGIQNKMKRTIISALLHLINGNDDDDAVVVVMVMERKDHSAIN